MPALTVAAVRKTAAQIHRQEIRDTLAPGLYLVVQPKPSGAKSWALRFRRPDGRPAKLTLGPVDLGEKETADAPVLGAALTLRQARELANQIDRARVRGVDVIAERKQSAGTEFGDAVRQFFADYKTKRHTRPRRWRDDARLLGLRWPAGADPATHTPEVIKGGLAATWASKPVATIDGAAIHSVVEAARREGIPGLARRNGSASEARGRKMHAALSILFRWLLQRRLVTSNPTVGVWHPGAPPARDRVLSADELRAFWRACDQARAPYGPLLQVLLLTGCRLNEVVGMQRSELTDGVWTIPGTRTKNARPHTLPLPPLAQTIIAAAPAVEGGLVFSFSNRRLTGFSRVKAQLDQRMGAVLPWRLHDLRRTCASGMQRLGVRAEVVERCLNHVSGSYRGVAGIYQRDPMHDEMRKAFARWAAHVRKVVA